MKCLTCGQEIIQPTRGRKKEYCSKECRDIENFWHAFEGRFDSRPIEAEKLKLWKSRLFNLANCKEATSHEELKLQY